MGTEWISFICLLLAIPCWIAVTIHVNLSFFVAAFAIESELSQLKYRDQQKLIVPRPMHLRICRSGYYRACSSIEAHTRRRLYVLRYRGPADQG